MPLSNAVNMAINEELLTRFDRDHVGYVPEDKLSEAQPLAEALQIAGRRIEEAVEMLRSYRYADKLMVAALIQLHSTELNDLAMILARTVAAKDPSGTDGRLGNRLQEMAEPFRITVRS